MPRNIQGVSSDIFQKQAGMRLSNDPGKWTDEILKRVLRMHPYLADRLQGDIDWSVEPIDDTSGDAVGLMTARVGDQPLRIPIVVRDFELKPVDLYLRPDGKMDLLDESVAMKHPQQGSVQLGRDVRPHSGQPMYGSGGGLGTTGMIQKISSGGQFVEDCDRMADHVTEDFPELEQSFERLQKKAGKSVESDWDTIVVEYDESPLHGDQFKMAGFRQGERTVDITASRHEVFEDPESDMAKWAREAMEEGFTIQSRRDLGKKAFVVDRSNGGEVNRFAPGDRVEISEDGDTTTGTAYRLVRLRAPYPDDVAAGHVFLGDNGEYMQPISMPAEGSSSSGDPLSGSESLSGVEVGQRGFLVIPQEEGPPALTGPVFLEEWMQDEANDFILALRSRLEGRTYLQISEVMPKVQHIKKDENPRGNSRYIVPDDVEFVPAEEMDEVPEENEKIAEEDGPSYHLSKEGEVVEIQSGREYSETETPKRMVGLLESLGATPGSARTAVKEATIDPARGSIRIDGLEKHAQNGRRSEPEGSDAQEKVSSVIEKWARGRQAINRLAAQMPQVMQQAGPAPQHPMMPGRGQTRQQRQSRAPQQQAPQQKPPQQAPQQQGSQRQEGAQQGKPSPKAVASKILKLLQQHPEKGKQVLKKAKQEFPKAYKMVTQHLDQQGQQGQSQQDQPAQQGQPQQGQPQQGQSQQGQSQGNPKQIAKKLMQKVQQNPGQKKELLQKAKQKYPKATQMVLQQLNQQQSGQQQDPRTPEGQAESVEEVSQQQAQKEERQDKQQLQAPGQERGKELQDSLSAVNVLNQYNADKFSGAVSELETSKRSVAELLYRVRTGAVDLVEEDIAKEALTALDSVIDGLKELKSVN